MLVAAATAPKPHKPSPLILKWVSLCSCFTCAQAWSDHFAWNYDFTLVIGLTATGRATVEALRLNRPGVVNLRRALLAIAEHPPLP